MIPDSSNVTSGPFPQDPGQPTELPAEIPILPLDGMVIFPLMIAPIVISDEKAKQPIEDSMRGDRMVAIFHPVEQEPDVAGGNGHQGETPEYRLFPVGTLCNVLRMLRIPDGSVRLLLHGICRVRLGELTGTDPYLKGRLEVVTDEEGPQGDLEVEAMMKLTIDHLQRAINLGALSEELAVAAMNVEDPGKLADLVASNLPVKPQDLLPILAEQNAKERLRKMQHVLGREVHVLEIGNRINDEVRDEVDKTQRSFFLQQQLKAIRRELGEADPQEAEIEELARRVRETEMPERARRTAEKELGRLQSMPTAAAEYGVIRAYLEWILDLPWFVSSDDHIDIYEAKRILDEDHYGLEEIKDRILEYLSVIRLKQGNLKGPILCFVGPPGVGKTSLGRSIARATGRNFQNFSLGGMRDEAEIRGHRRTYVGAMPGRIVKALKESGTNNPLIMLDEVDKLGSDFRGDPASALLEVLDPEQNFHFTDHYMDMPVDLSRVMFVTTANTLDTIPGPLRDRMEIIRLPGYTDIEKEEIARRYLIPREMDHTGIKRSHLSISPGALRRIIGDYTAEAGVRNLQREISKLCRKTARRLAEAQSAEEATTQNGSDAPKGRKTTRRRASRTPASFAKLKVTPGNLEEFLGPKRAFQEVAERMGQPGIAIGLAWTAYGGAILFIEAARYPGEGRLRLTGQLGEVMKESAQAALTYLRATAERYRITEEAFRTSDFHVHVPAGATPKDGPSAGTAIAVALASLLTNRSVRDFIAMSGEITLRGNVMPVGGIKEKCLAAHRAGIREVFLPEHNEGDFREVPEQIREALKVRFLPDVGAYIEAALRG